MEPSGGRGFIRMSSWQPHPSWSYIAPSKPHQVSVWTLWDEGATDVPMEVIGLVGLNSVVGEKNTGLSFSIGKPFYLKPTM